MTQTVSAPIVQSPPERTISLLFFALSHVLYDQLHGLSGRERREIRAGLDLVAKDCRERVAACATDAERIEVLRAFIRGERS